MTIFLLKITINKVISYKQKAINRDALTKYKHLIIWN